MSDKDDTPKAGRPGEDRTPETESEPDKGRPTPGDGDTPTAAERPAESAADRPERETAAARERDHAGSRDEPRKPPERTLRRELPQESGGAQPRDRDRKQEQDRPRGQRSTGARESTRPGDRTEEARVRMEHRAGPGAGAGREARGAAGEHTRDATQTGNDGTGVRSGEAPVAAGAPREEPGRPEGQAPLTGRQRLAASLWPPRVSRAQLIVALLLFVLGLGLAIQVRSTSDNSALRGARQEDLVRILDELDNRSQRLEDEKGRLEDQRTELENSSDQAEEARKQTVQKEQQLGVLAGTVAAEGPGINLTVSDPRGAVESDMLLDAIQELRAAGAEAIQINGVRIVAGTYFSESGGGVGIDGKKVSQPYRFKVIGEPKDLEPALNIPGGVVQTMEKERATVSVTRAEKITVDALRPAEQPDYARSSSR